MEGGGGGGGRFERFTVGRLILGGGGGADWIVQVMGGKLEHPPPLGFWKFCYRSFLALLKLLGLPLISSLGGGGASTLEEPPPLCLAKNA